MTSSSASPAPSSYVQLNRWQMFLAYATGTFGFGFHTLVGFLVPLRAQELGAEPQVIGMIIGAGGLIPIFLSIPAGEWADRFGARRVYIIGAALSALATLGYALTDNYWFMLIIEFLVGFPRTMPWVASQAYISNVGTPAQRTTIVGRFSSATQLVQLFGPLIAGAIAALAGYKGAFWFVLLVAVTYTLMGIALPEVHNSASGGRTKASSAGGFGAAVRLIRLPIEQTAMVMTFTRIWVLVSWGSFYPLLLARQGIDPFIIGTVLSFHGLVATVTSLLAGPMAKRLGQVGATGAALLVGTLGLLISPFLMVFPLFYLPSPLIGFMNGVTLPLLITLVSMGAPPDLKGVALGLRTSANRVAVTVAPVVMGTLVTTMSVSAGYVAAAGTGWGLIAMAAVIYFRGRHSERDV